MMMYRSEYVMLNTEYGLRPFTDLFVTMRNGRTRYSRFFDHISKQEIEMLAKATYKRMKSKE